MLELSEADLRGLAGALRSGRISPPFSAAMLQRFVGSGAAVAEWFNGVASAGCSGAAMAIWLEALAERAVGRVEDAVQLVTTGPEGTDSVHRDTAVVVQDLFRRARSSVWISGFAIYQGRAIFQELAERMDANLSLHVRMFLDIRAEESCEPAETIARFMQRFKDQHWPAGSRLPEIYYDTRSASGESVLHAKCIIVDGEELFVSSANFTEAALHRNVEVGVLVRSRPIAEQARRFFDSLARSGHCRRVA